MSEWSEFDTAYDLPPFPGTPRTYLVATTQRTGSHYLAYLLACDGSLGAPFEYVNGHRVFLELERRGWPQGEQSEVRLLEEVIQRRTGPSGWFGVKSHWHTWAAIQSKPAIRSRVAPQRVIYLSREDLTAQAVSLAMAEITGEWVNVGHRATSPADFDRARVEDALRRIEVERAAWEAFLGRWPGEVLRLRYEDLIASPDVAVDEVFGYLGAARAPKQRSLTPLRPTPDDLLEGWVAQFRRTRVAEESQMSAGESRLGAATS